MDYKEKFEDFLSRIQRLLDNTKKQGHIIVRVKDLENTFPELVESEDEKIRKEILSLIQYTEGRRIGYRSHIDLNKMIAWLEKQGEQTLIDNVEPKFKVGDWILLDKPCQIESTDMHGNYLVKYCDAEGISILSRKFCETYFRLWSIQDAKLGDVLVNDTILIIVDHLGIFENTPIIYSWYFADSKKFYGIGSTKPDRWEVKGFKPATKEQRDLLFQKMKEAGYMWNAEKKELKNIRQTSTLREEDENRIKDIISFLDTEKNHYASTLEEHYASILEELDTCIDWLKSLKERYTWKPSNEQMKALEHFVRSIGESGFASPYDNNTKLLYSLLEQLKKL